MIGARSAGRAGDGSVRERGRQERFLALTVASAMSMLLVVAAGATRPAVAQSSPSTTVGPAPSSPSPNSPSTAKRAATQFVDVLLTPPAGQDRECDKKTHRGFLAKRAYYLASCESSDGSFAFFTVVSATGKTPTVRSRYYKERMATLCASGHAYATGVRGLFANTYAGTGAGVDVANRLAGTAAHSFETASGYVAPVQVC